MNSIKARNSTAEPALRARVASEVDRGAKTSNRVMFVPAGVHTIAAGFGPGSARVTIRVDRETAAVLQASLAKLNSEHAPQRALFDANHEEKEAMGWPLRFEWSDSPEPGVYAVTEWSALGSQYIDGRVMRAFSGQFFTDAALPKASAVRAGQTYSVGEGKRGSQENPARITGLDFPYAGTLTNDPAFRKILPLWASRAGAHSSDSDEGVNKTNQNKMKRKTAEELAALRATKTKLEQEIPGLKARHEADKDNAAAATDYQQAEADLVSVSAQLQADELLEKSQALEESLLAQRTKDAESAVQDAVKRGAIAAKDVALQAEWKKRCVEDPANIALVAKMNGSPALSPRVTFNRVEIMREDPVSVLKAYNAEKDSRKKGAIYARDIAKLIQDGVDLPVAIAATNTLGTLAGEIVTQRALELLTLNLPILNRISTDFSPEGAVFNKAIVSRVVGIPGTSDYSTSTGYATENTLTTDVSVTISEHKSCQVSFNANELAATSRRLFDELAPAMQYAIGKVVCDALYAEITAAQFTETPIDEALVDFDRQTVIAIGGALSDDGNPEMGRTLLLNGAYFDKLFSDSAIVSLATFQQRDLITQAQMIPVHGFDVIRAANFPSALNVVGFGMTKSALVLATRLPNDYSQALPGATGGGIVSTITEPRTGLSLMLTQFVDHQLGAAYARVAIMYGTAPGQVKAGVVVRSAAP
jgi:hypothetical protein